MKKLTLPDSFAFARVLKSCNIEDKINELIDKIINRKIEKKEVQSEDEEFQGKDGEALKLFINIILSSTSKETEELIYEFLSGVFEVSVDEVKKMSFSELGNNFKELAKENDLINFISGAQKLMK